MAAGTATTAARTSRKVSSSTTARPVIWASCQKEVPPRFEQTFVQERRGTLGAVGCSGRAPVESDRRIECHVWWAGGMPRYVVVNDVLDSVLDALLRAIIVRGELTPSLRRLASDAGMSPAGIVHHF